MKNNILFLSLFFLVCCCFFQVQDLCAAGAGGKKIQLELYGGFSTLNPGDLNHRVDYDMIREEFLNELKYKYYDLLLGDNFTYSTQVEGELKRIKNALPFGLRLRYSLNSSLSLSIGFQYLSKRQDSRVAYRYEVRSLNPDDIFYYDEFSASSESSPYSLSVKGYAPMIGIHYKIKASRFLEFEAYFTTGILFVECSYARQHRYKKSNSYGYWYEQNVSYEIKGKGKGYSNDIGIRINLDVAKNFDLFIETGFSSHAASNISGPGKKETVFNEVNSSGFTETTSWEGTWDVVGWTFTRPWGYLNTYYPSNEYSTSYRSFVLDLSGFQVRMGISFKF
jgi:hypothetical protein